MRWQGSAAGLALALALPPAPAAGDEPAALWISTDAPGVYRVAFEELAAAGLPDTVASAELGLTNRGESIPLWVEDGGDGVFGPGEHLELVAEVLAGAGAYYHEYSPWNVYRLSWDGATPRRMEAVAAPGPATNDGAGWPLRRRRHLEEDRLLIRVGGSGARVRQPPERPSGERPLERQASERQAPELWYWAKLTHADRQPWALPLPLGDLDPAGGKAALRIHLQALSKPRIKPDGETDHRLEVTLDGSPLGTAAWDGKTAHLFELPDVDAALLAGDGPRRLELRIPERSAGEGRHAIVDVVMLNWIELDYPRRPEMGEDQIEVHLGAAADADVVLSSPSASSLVAYGSTGRRVETARSALATEYRFRFRPAAGDGSFHLVPDGRFLAPARIAADRPSAWRDGGHQADYLMIAHRRLIDAVRPLAELHRRRGLVVALVDVDDVYDEFNHGIVHPRAIRDFIAHAQERWRPPAPRFVLLVGDASWDTKNSTVDDSNYANWSDRQLLGGERFATKESVVYDRDPELNRRQLVPTWNHATYQGHSASDNYFVAVDGDDHLPDLAIGRLPVAEPSEVAQIVDKIAAYVTSPEVGPWRRSVLFITNENRGFQRRSDELARQLSAIGFAAEKIYPASSEAANEHHTRRILEVLDRGQLAVHFLGHGGRYIWRTGPPDLKKNHDLFTLDDLDRLEPTHRLPVVLSLTCFTAPFDHPNADSIGEKLLRIPERGAIAVLAASWRNGPRASWGESLLEELTAPGATIGEAVMRAKHAIGNHMFVETYNLLGDPAVPVPQPAAGIDLAVTPQAGGLGVQGVIGLEEFAGEVLVELVDSGGNVLRASTVRPTGREFTLRVEASGEELAAARGVRAYAWDVSRSGDAVGSFELAADPDVALPAAGPSTGGGGSP